MTSFCTRGWADASIAAVSPSHARSSFLFTKVGTEQQQDDGEPDAPAAYVREEDGKGKVGVVGV